MAKINKALLRKAKGQIRKSAKEGNQQAIDILGRRGARRAERTDTNRDAQTERRVKTLSWNFVPGELVGFKPNRAARYNSQPNDLYLIIGTTDQRGSNHEESAGNLTVTGPLGVITVRAADMKKF